MVVWKVVSGGQGRVCTGQVWTVNSDTGSQLGSPADSLKFPLAKDPHESRSTAEVLGESGCWSLYTGPKRLLGYYSGYWELNRLRSTEAGGVIKKLKANFRRLGSLCQFVSDNGPQLVAAEFQKTCELSSNIMLQNELEGEVVRFITHAQTCLATSQLREY